MYVYNCFRSEGPVSVKSRSTKEARVRCKWPQGGTEPEVGDSAKKTEK